MVHYLLTHLMKPHREKERDLSHSEALQTHNLCEQQSICTEKWRTDNAARPDSHSWAASFTLICFHIWLNFLKWKGRSRQDSEDWNTCTSTNMRFYFEFFSHLQSCRSIWKSQYLEVIGDQCSKCRNNPAYFLAILLSSVFSAPGVNGQLLTGQCSRIVPKKAFFRTQSEEILNCFEYHSEEKKWWILSHLWLGKRHSSQHYYQRIYTKKCQNRQQMLSRIRNSPLQWSLIYATA